MLLLAAAWIALLTAAATTGLAVLHVLRGAPAFDRLGDRMVAASWVGLIALGVALQAASLALPLKPVVGLSVAIVGTAGALSLSPVRHDLSLARARATPGLVVAGLVLVAGVAAYVAQRVVWGDTGLYHAGAIRWLSEHGAVRGVGHLHSRFGYSSIWFDLTAPFNDGDLRHRLSAVVSGFGLLLAAVQFALASSRVLAGRTRTADWIAFVGLGIAVPIALVWKQPIAPNPDFPLILLPVVTAWAIASAHAVTPVADRRRPVADARLVPLVLAAGAMTIKTSGAALLAVALLFYVWPPRAQPFRAVLAAAIVALVVGPSLLTGYELSGCPLYPAPPCFDKIWALDREAADNEAAAIRSYARRRIAIPDEELVSTDWVGSWVRRGQNVFLLLTLVLGGAAAVRAPRQLRWLLAVGFSGVAVVLYSAPDLRFALGYCALLVAVFCLRWSGAAWKRVGRHPLPRSGRVVGLALVTAALGASFFAARVAWPTVEGDHGLALVKPPAMDRPRLERTAVGNVYYFFPADGELCWSSPLPCTSTSLVRSDTTLRDPGVGLDAGFDHHR